MMNSSKQWLSPWLARPLAEHRATFIKVGIAAVLTNLFALATSLYSMTVYNRIVPNNATDSLIALSIGITVYAFWPALGTRFDKAAKSILDDEDGPCR